MTVTPEQLKYRAKAMESRWQQFDNMAASQGGRMKLHETWRYHYTSNPYLLGAPDDRLASRFKDVFVNQTELTENAQIAPLPIGEEHAFMEKFTHLLEEYGLRSGGLAPPHVIQAARAPMLKYFENGEPIATKIFRNYAAPTSPFTVKYGRREHLEPMLRAGRVRISPASYYNDAGHNDAVMGVALLNDRHVKDDMQIMTDRLPVPPTLSYVVRRARKSRNPALDNLIGEIGKDIGRIGGLALVG